MPVSQQNKIIFLQTFIIVYYVITQTSGYVDVTCDYKHDHLLCG